MCGALVHTLKMAALLEPLWSLSAMMASTIISAYGGCTAAEAWRDDGILCVCGWRDGNFVSSKRADSLATRACTRRESRVLPDFLPLPAASAHLSWPRTCCADDG